MEEALGNVAVYVVSAGLHAAAGPLALYFCVLSCEKAVPAQFAIGLFNCKLVFIVAVGVFPIRSTA